MRQGLLLKESPEPTNIFYCGGCKNKVAFLNVDEYKKHRLEVHNQRLEYLLDEYDYQYGGEGKIFHATDWTKKWVTPQKSQGRMAVPLVYSGGRPTRRFLMTTQELFNRLNKICYCGKPVKKPRRKYCSDKHAMEWLQKNEFWESVKNRVLKKREIRTEKSEYKYNDRIYYSCESCNEETKKPEVDHIIAIILGGHPWHEYNLRVLCHDCHNIKTKSDLQVLSWWRRESNYDIGQLIPESQTMLDKFS